MPSLLTAVSVAVENDHTIAFLGNNKGEIFKVKLFSDLLLFSTFFLNFFTWGEDNSGIKELMFDVNFLLFAKVHLKEKPHVYSKMPVDTVGEKVNKNLFFDLSHSNLYITTEKKVCLPYCFSIIYLSPKAVQQCLHKEDLQGMHKPLQTTVHNVTTRRHSGTVLAHRSTKPKIKSIWSPWVVVTMIMIHI